MIESNEHLARSTNRQASGLKWLTGALVIATLAQVIVSAVR
jgi:hypothetical protein